MSRKGYQFYFIQFPIIILFMLQGGKLEHITWKETLLKKLKPGEIYQFWGILRCTQT